MTAQATAGTYAERLNKLAQDQRFDSRAEDLRSLAQDLALEDGDRWAGVDLFAAFPADYTLRLLHPNWLERFLGVLAGVSVFLPVAWTWWGFHSASGAYETLLQTKKEPEGSTFLGLWATGFEGGLDGWHRLVPMAAVSVSLIVFAIACLVGHRLSAGVNVRREESAAQIARGELLTALTGAQLVMNERRADHPTRIEGIIKSSMEKLHEAHEATRASVVDLTVTSGRVAADMSSLLDSVKKAGKEARKLIESAASAGSSLEGAAERTEQALTSSLATLDAAVSSSVARAQESLTASARELAEALRTALQRFEAALGSHLDGFTGQAVSALSHAGSQLAVVVGRIEENARASSISAREIGEQVKASTHVNESAAHALRDQIGVLADENGLTRNEIVAAIGDVRETLDGIESALTRHESALQGQASELTGARDAAEQMLRRLTLVSGGHNDSATSNSGA